MSVQGFNRPGDGAGGLKIVDKLKLIPGNIKYGVTIGGVTGNVPAFSAGNLLAINNSTIVSKTGTTATKVKETTIQTAGMYRISYLFQGNANNNYYYSQLYINGVPQGTEQQLPYATCIAGVTYTQDIYLNVGDVVSVYGRAQTGNTNVGFSGSSLTFGILAPTGVNTTGY